MILNKHGWGLREMLILSGIIVLFLLIAIYLIYIFYNDVYKGNNNYYKELENNLKNQASIYLDEYNGRYLTNEKLTIPKSVLENNGLNVNLKDKNNEDCNGYILAYKTHGKEYIEPYIKCSKYTTDGYEDWREQ